MTVPNIAQSLSSTGNPVNGRLEFNGASLVEPDTSMRTDDFESHISAAAQPADAHGNPKQNLTPLFSNDELDTARTSDEIDLLLDTEKSEQNEIFDVLLSKAASTSVSGTDPEESSWRLTAIELDKRQTILTDTNADKTSLTLAPDVVTTAELQSADAEQISRKVNITTTSTPAQNLSPSLGVGGKSSYPQQATAQERQALSPHSEKNSFKLNEQVSTLGVYSKQTPARPPIDGIAAQNLLDGSLAGSVKPSEKVPRSTDVSISYSSASTGHNVPQSGPDTSAISALVEPQSSPKSEERLRKRSETASPEHQIPPRHQQPVQQATTMVDTFVSAAMAKTGSQTTRIDAIESTDVEREAQQDFSAQTVRTQQISTMPSLGLQRIDIPRHLAAQLQEVIRAMPDRPIDISLRPEELGRVRLSIAASEAGVTLNVLAERPDTLDLMRRHADALVRELTDLGFASVNLAFEQGTESGFGDDDSSGEGSGSTTHLSLDAADDAENSTAIALNSGLDSSRALDKRI